MKDDRNWNDPQYKEWRLAVYRRDSFTCQMPGCSRKGFAAKIQAHHIKRWADAPELRFQVSNGVTLCKRCHTNIDSQEQSYEALFMSIVSKQKNNFIPPKKKSASDSSINAKRLLYSTDTDGDDGGEEV